MYLTFVEYTEMGGQTVDETAFNELEFEARSIIDWWTFNRLQNEVVQSNAVKMCMLKLIKLILDKQVATAVKTPDSSETTKIMPGIVQESNDGVSTMYNTISVKEAINHIDSEIQATVQMYLQGLRNSLGHKVLYRGVYPDE